jgi:hypothetical protein
MKAAAEAARFSREEAFGQSNTPTYIEAILEGDGLQITDTPELVEIAANSHFPSIKSREIVGFNVPLSYSAPLYVPQCEDLIQMGWERDADHELYSYVWEKRDAYMLQVANGCKVQTMKLEWSSNALVRIALEMIAAKLTKTAGGTFTSGTDVCTGMPFKGARVTLSINGTTYDCKESGSLTVENNLTEGPAEGEDFAKSFIDAGMRVTSGSFKAKMKAATWDAFKATLTNGDLTRFPAVLTFANNIAAAPQNLVLTFAAGSLVATDNKREAGSQGDTVMQTLEVVDHTTAPVWTFPS